MFFIQNLETLYYLANIFAPIITTVGICVSFWFSKKTLDQVRKDRILSQRPYLLFEQGGMADKVVYVKNDRRSPGYNPKTVEIVKKDIPEDAISLQRDFLNSTFGTLKNYGNGTAFNISLTWIPRIIWINEEKFSLDSKKIQEPKYSETFNTKPVGKFNLPPEQTTGILHWPMFIEMDYSLCISRVEGYFRINCDDSFGNHYSTYQGYHLFTQYKEDIPHIHVTFLESFSNEKDWRFEE